MGNFSAKRIPDPVDESCCDDDISDKNERFLYLIRHGSKAEIEQYLEQIEVNMNYKNVNGDTPLHVAIKKRRPCIVSLLMSKEADDKQIFNNEEMNCLDLVDKLLTKHNECDKLIEIKKILESDSKASESEDPVDDIEIVYRKQGEDEKSILIESP